MKRPLMPLNEASGDELVDPLASLRPDGSIGSGSQGLGFRV